jgi:hypothetical protein
MVVNRQALLAPALCGLSFRALGLQTALTGIESFSEKTWRRRFGLAETRVWRLLLRTLDGSTTHPGWLPERGAYTRIVLLDVSCLKDIGGSGDNGEGIWTSICW